MVWLLVSILTKLTYERASFLELNDRHVGETIFVVGSGPQLAHLRDDQVRALEARITIAVNKVFYRLRPTYFLSAYVGEMLLAQRRIPGSTLIHMRPVFEPPLVDGVMPLRRRHFDPAVGLSRRLEAPEPIIATKQNVALGCTHLAYVMGASRIVYVGVEQRNLFHFYNFDEGLRQTLRADLIERGDPPILAIDHPQASLANDLTQVDRPTSELLQPFYSVDHTPTFAGYFDVLRTAGVPVVATTQESVVADAGAEVRGLDEILDTTPEAGAPA